MDPTLLPTVVSAQPLATEDRRRSDRVEQQIPAWISGESTDRGARGGNITVIDVSAHGVGFYDPQSRYRIGAAHWLIVNGPMKRMSTRVKIVSCREISEGGFVVGAAFF